MSIVFGILLSLFVFTVIVFIHELGHFLAARKAGVTVEEFGIGIPPRAKELGKDAKGTLYTLNWLPI
jgi:regulator of sigma E protease